MGCHKSIAYGNIILYYSKGKTNSRKYFPILLCISTKKHPSYVFIFNNFICNRIEYLPVEEWKSYAQMNKDTLKVFETAEGNLSMTVMNPITIEHFDK